jgi:hypothetical protein
VWGERLTVDELELSDIKNVERYCEYLSNKFDRIHILINNAAQTITRPAGWLNKMDIVNKNANLMLTCGDDALSSNWNVSLSRDEKTKSNSHYLKNSNVNFQEIKNVRDDIDVIDIENNNGIVDNDNTVIDSELRNSNNRNNGIDNGHSNNNNNNNNNNDNENKNVVSNYNNNDNDDDNDNEDAPNNRNDYDSSNNNSTVMVTLDDSAQPLDKSGKYRTFTQYE